MKRNVNNNFDCLLELNPAAATQGALRIGELRFDYYYEWT